MQLISENTTFLYSCQQSGVDDPNFAHDLLTELTRTFLAYADNVRAQDSAAYAIQVRKMRPNTKNTQSRMIVLFYLFEVSNSMICCLSQELLSIFECREGRTDSPGRRLWRRFPEQIQEILEPHLNSRSKSPPPQKSWKKLILLLLCHLQYFDDSSHAFLQI